MTSNLRIPKCNDQEEIAWRLKFIREYLPEVGAVVSFESLLSILAGLSQGTVVMPDGSVCDVSALFETIVSSLEFGLDEVDVALLFTATTCRHLNTLSDASKQMLLDLAAGEILNLSFDGKNSEKSFETPEAFIKMKADIYQAQYLPRIRAKLAALELLASWHRADAIIKLVSICPKYLRDEITHQWILHQQWLYRYSNDEKISQVAGENLASLFSAIKGDKRKVKTRIYKYWACVSRYKTLSRVITVVRSNFSKHTPERWKDVLALYNIPEDKFALLGSGPISPANLALEIMSDQRDIDSPKSFRDFQPHVSKLSLIHKELAEDTFLMSFLDYPFQHPSSVAQTDIWAILDDLKV